MDFKDKYKSVIVLSTSLDASTQQLNGTQFRKQIVKYGEWVNPLFPIESMTLDEDWAKSIIDNFDSGLVGKIPVPLDHTDATEANTGEVVSLESVKGDGLYAILDVRRPEVVDDINNGLIFDVSISFDWDYIDTADGKHYGPTLLHVALVNNPYLKGMDGFEQLSRDITKKLALPNKGSVIMLSEAKAKELSNMETATVKNDKDYEVKISVKDEDGEVVERTLAAGEETEVPKDQAEEVTTQIADAVAPEGDNDDDNDDDLDDEDELPEGEKEQLSALRKRDAKHRTEKMYSTLLSKGKITPAQKEAFMQLSEVAGNKVELSGKQVTLSRIVFDILSAGPKVLKFSEDGSGKGKNVDDKKDEDKKPSEDLSEAERAGFQAVGADPKAFDEYSEKYPELVSASLNNGKESK